MAQTLSTLRTLLGNLQQLDLDNYAGASPSSSDLNAQINIAMRWFANQTRCCYSDQIALTLTAGTRVYSMQDLTIVAKRMIEVESVIINNVRLCNYRGDHALWNLQTYRRLYDGYLNYPDGTPSAAYRIDGYRIGLSPAPNATVVSDGDNYVTGVYLPATLANNDDVPDIPEQYHEWIAMIAASFSSTPLVSEAEGWKRLDAYNAMLASDIRQLKAASTSLRMPENAIRGEGSVFGCDRIGGREW